MFYHHNPELEHPGTAELAAFSILNETATTKPHQKNNTRVGDRPLARTRARNREQGAFFLSNKQAERWVSFASRSAEGYEKTTRWGWSHLCLSGGAPIKPAALGPTYRASICVR